jgi:hypothetical protein
VTKKLVSGYSKRCFSSSKHPDQLLGPQPPKYDEHYKQSDWDMKLTTQKPSSAKKNEWKLYLCLAICLLGMQKDRFSFTKFTFRESKSKPTCNMFGLLVMKFDIVFTVT